MPGLKPGGTRVMLRLRNVRRETRKYLLKR
jgi:hypothetical protein